MKSCPTIVKQLRCVSIHDSTFAEFLQDRSLSQPSSSPRFPCAKWEAPPCSQCSLLQRTLTKLAEDLWGAGDSLFESDRPASGRDDSVALCRKALGG